MAQTVITLNPDPHPYPSQNIENKRRHTRGELLAYGFCFLLLLFILFPLLVVLADAFFPLLLEKRKVGMGLDLQGFRYVWQWYSPHLWLSLKLGILSVIACLGIGVPASYGFLKYPGWGTQLLEEMLLLPLSIPGIALALALIQTYSILRGAWYLILVGHTLYALPFLVRSVTGALRQGKVLELERCAASLGASRWQRFRYVFFPYLRHAMMVGSLLVFAISFGEFNVSFLLNTPVNQTFPAGLYLTYIQNSVSISSAATTLFLLVVIPILLALQYGGGKAADALPHQQA